MILIYDIKVDEQGKKVLPKVYKCCSKYLTHVQNSVFEGEITLSKKLELETEIKNYVRDEKDSVIIYILRSDKYIEKEFWANDYDATSQFL